MGLFQHLNNEWSCGKRSDKKGDTRKLIYRRFFHFSFFLFWSWTRSSNTRLDDLSVRLFVSIRFDWNSKENFNWYMPYLGKIERTGSQTWEWLSWSEWNKKVHLICLFRKAWFPFIFLARERDVYKSKWMAIVYHWMVSVCMEEIARAAAQHNK